MAKSQNKQILDFLSEAGILKRIKRSGWWVLGIKNPESVAEHSFRCAVIAYCISVMEGLNSHEAVIMALFNDIHEARINDAHKMAQKYIDYVHAEDKAFFDQIKDLPFKLKSDLAQLHQKYRSQKSKAAIIARDADILECLIQAKEYHEYGYKQARKFMKKAPKFLRTKSAKQLWSRAKKSSLNDWWQGIGDFRR